MRVTSVYVNGRFYKDEQGVIHRSAMINACIDRNQWVKIVHKSNEKYDFLFCVEAWSKLKFYIQETYVKKFRYEFDERCEADWTEVHSLEELNWKFEPDYRWLRVKVRNLQFNERVIIDRDKVIIDAKKEET